MTAVGAEHNGGRTYGIRVDAPGDSLAYLPDHAPAASVLTELLAMLDPVDC